VFDTVPPSKNIHTLLTELCESTPDRNARIAFQANERRLNSSLDDSLHRSADRYMIGYLVRLSSTRPVRRHRSLAREGKPPVKVVYQPVKDGQVDRLSDSHVVHAHMKAALC
jgi:hypothetical protein